MAIFRNTVQALLAFLLLFAMACQTGTATPDEPITESVTEELSADLPGLLVDADWVAARQDHRDLLLLHIGDDEDSFLEGHIPGQIFLSFQEIVIGDFEQGFRLPDRETLLEVFAAAGVDDQKSIVLTGDLEGLFATRAFMTLEALGRRENVALLQGGLQEWRDQDRPLSTERTTPSPGSFAPEVQERIIVDSDFVLAHLGDRQTYLVDARPPQEFRGEVAGPGVERAGHIPGAQNIFWKTTLSAEDRPLLKDRDQIKSIYKDRGIDESANLIAYCRTGMQASFGYFLGRLMERDILVYDGSYVDWSRQLELPITGPRANDSLSPE